MKAIIIGAAAAILAVGAAGTAEARSGGCIKYGLGGAVIGHLAGGHGVAGAAAGCALGAYKRHRDENSAYRRGEGTDTTGTVSHRTRNDNY